MWNDTSPSSTNHAQYWVGRPMWFDCSGWCTHVQRLHARSVRFVARCKLSQADACCCMVSPNIMRRTGASARPLVHSTAAHHRQPRFWAKLSIEIGRESRHYLLPAIDDAFIQVCLTATWAFNINSRWSLVPSSASRSENQPLAGVHTLYHIFQ